MSRIPTARDVACPQCGAAAGEPCVGTVRNSHGARVSAHDRTRSKTRAKRERQDALARWKRRAEAFEKALRAVAPHTADAIERALAEDERRR